MFVHNAFIKRFIITLIYGLLFSLLFLGVTCTSFQPTIRQAMVHAPLMYAPLHLPGSNPHNRLISGRISLNQTTGVGGRRGPYLGADASGVTHLDIVDFHTFDEAYYDPARNPFAHTVRNVEVSFPSMQIMADYEVGLQQEVLWSVGLSYARANRRNLFGIRTGLGIPLTYKDFGFRLDLGLTSQSVAQQISILDFIGVHPTDSSISHFRLHSEDTKASLTGAYIAATIVLHTVHDKIRPFIQIGHGVQGILDLDDDAALSLFSIMPGVSFHSDPGIEFIVGIRFHHLGSLDNLSRRLNIIPVFQIDYGL